MQIKELAKATGLSAATIRFYESQGLLTKVKRLQNGYREYSQYHLDQLNLVFRAKDLGFSMKEVKELSNLLLARNLSRKDMAEKLIVKNQQIEMRIQNLKQVQKEIKNALAGNCEYKSTLS